MNRHVSTENFQRQERQSFNAFTVYRQYEKRFPDKITIAQDCIDVKDVKHFNKWLKNRPQ